MIIDDITMRGMDRINDNIDQLTQGIRDRQLKKAMDAALNPILRNAKARVSRDTGTLHSAIQKQVKSLGMKGVTVYGVVGIRRGIKVPMRVISRGPRKGQVYALIPTRYAHLIERGHKIVVNGPLWEKDPKSKFGRLRPIKDTFLNKFMGRPAPRTGEVVGFAKARPFMRPAWDLHGGERALRVFVTTLDKGIQSEVSKLRTRGPSGP